MIHDKVQFWAVINFRKYDPEMATGGGARKPGVASSLPALRRMDARMEAHHDIIQRKRQNIQLMTEERDEADEEEKKVLSTTIKALQMDLQEDLDFMKGIEEDFNATKAAVQEELERESEREVEEGEEPAEERREKTYTGDEVEMMMAKEVDRRVRLEKHDSSIIAMESRMERLITALATAREPPIMGGGGGRDGGAGERKRTLGMAPSFVTGQSDFVTHIESFRDFTQLNDITQSEKVKRLFLITLDQKARMRCAGLEPDRPPCLGMTADEYIARLQELFVPRATLLIVQQAFHDLRQKAHELASDYVLAKWSHFKRGWNSPNAPFSFFYEAATTGLYDENLRNEIFREIITCNDSNSRVEMNAAFQQYLERVQQSLAYVRRTGATANPDGRGLGITGQTTKAVSKPGQGNSEIQLLEQLGEDEEEGEEEDECEELDEQQIAFAEALEDPRFTQLVLDDFNSVEETEAKLCFLCKSPNHLARSCGMRMRNLSSAMGRMGFRPRGNPRRGRQGARWRGGWRGSSRGPARGRGPPLSGFPTQLPASTPTIRPITSAQPGYSRAQDF